MAGSALPPLYLALLYSVAGAGPLRPGTARTFECARVQFPGEAPDTFFGTYEEDFKNGPGIYCFATGAFYVGGFKVGSEGHTVGGLKVGSEGHTVLVASRWAQRGTLCWWPQGGIRGMHSIAGGLRVGLDGALLPQERGRV